MKVVKSFFTMNIINVTSVRELHREIRGGLKLTEAEMARKMGISRQRYAYLEDRSERITLDELHTLWKLSGLSRRAFSQLILR